MTDQVLEERLPAAAGAYFRARAVIDAAIIALVGSASALPFSSSAAVIIGLCLLLGLVGGGLLLELSVLIPLRLRWTTFTADGTTVRLWSGRIFRRSVTIPIARILNVEIKQGPLLRRFGLVGVGFVTIAGKEVLQPLASDRAEYLRSLPIHHLSGDR